MTREETQKKRSLGWGLLIVTVIVVAAGVYFYLERGRQPAEEATMLPSTEWTTKPEEGVEVKLPETPMTNVPAGSATSENLQPGSEEETAPAAEGVPPPAQSDNP